MLRTRIKVTNRIDAAWVAKFLTNCGYGYDLRVTPTDHATRSGYKFTRISGEVTLDQMKDIDNFCTTASIDVYHRYTKSRMEFAW